MLVHLGHHHSRDPAQLDPWCRLESDVDPVAELARLQRDPLAVDRDVRNVGRPIDVDHQWQLHRRVAVHEVVLRPLELGLEAVAVARKMNPDAALLDLLAALPRREVDERPLGTEQIRHAHRRQLRAAELLGREGDRHPQHRAPDVVLAEDRPEGLRLAEQAELRLAERDLELPQLEATVDGTDLGRRQHRQVGAAVAVEKVVDVVARRVGAGRERRPGNG